MSVLKYKFNKKVKIYFFLNIYATQIYIKIKDLEISINKLVSHKKYLITYIFVNQK